MEELLCIFTSYLGMALDIQNTFSLDTLYKNSRHKINICEFQKNRRLFWCLTYIGLMKIVGDTVFQNHDTCFFSVFSLPTSKDS